MREIEKIHKFVNLSLDIDINVKGRKRDVVYGRSLFYALSRKCTMLSLERIGLYLGEEDKALIKDHVTVLYGANLFYDVVIFEGHFKKLYDFYMFTYLADIKDKEELDQLALDKLIEENSLHFFDEKEQLLRVIGNKNNIIKEKDNTNNLLIEQINTLEVENINLKINLGKKEPFLEGYYNLQEQEKETVKERLNLIIRLMPSNQKRKEVFEIINCQS